MMILEALITTENEDGTMHLSAIGPHVDPSLSRWELKPFVTSTTYKNLRRTNRCIIHVTDDVLMLARVVTRRAEVFSADYLPDVGFVLEDVCRSIAIQLHKWNSDDLRPTAIGQSVWQRDNRPFWGWNRAKHGVLEFAIAATRIGIVPSNEIDEVHELASRLVKKTGGDDERLALELLEEFVKGQLAVALENR